ncbi:MAG: hypothetical protein AVDCRST_MAG38-2547 [uncultured Solirubrobacteraceae bacterium]|uniref:Uncharacterized protein n=1 Tax=uncultured Solirubrobacteraceae bacterium TaxID=1162706 RepID=A0A6J4S539_9ACTN|nr:MAG: hypothetical protein AVDCRST_MAG38-2547 [uncultured Solirubrobacteraceae bacterium]
MSNFAGTNPASPTPSATFGLAAAGGATVMGLIPLTAVAGEWWLLGVAFAALLLTAGLVVRGFFGLLAQTGDPAIDGRTPVARRRPAAARPASERGTRAPALGTA